MDSFASGPASTSLGSARLDQVLPHDLVTTNFLIIMASLVWLLELIRRSGGLNAKACSTAICQIAPELLGLMGIAAFTAAALTHGENRGVTLDSPEDKALWQAIKAEWPLLTTADSLLGLQAMLRLVLVASAALRAASPFAGLPAVYFLSAAVSRVALLALSPKDIYHLDGPLGGTMNAAIEVAALVPLLYLSRSAGLDRVPLILCSLLVVVLVACGNHLSLAPPEQGYLDALFSSAHLSEFLGAVAFLASAVAAVAEGTPTLGTPAALVHCMLPLQQLLSAYFMLTAWGAAPFQSVPELVGAGWPFEVLQYCAVAQVGIFLVAAVLRLAFSDPEAKQATGYLLEGNLDVEV